MKHELDKTIALYTTRKSVVLGNFRSDLEDQLTDLFSEQEGLEHDFRRLVDEVVEDHRKAIEDWFDALIASEVERTDKEAAEKKAQVSGYIQNLTESKKQLINLLKGEKAKKEEKD